MDAIPTLTTIRVATAGWRCPCFRSLTPRAEEEKFKIIYEVFLYKTGMGVGQWDKGLCQSLPVAIHNAHWQFQIVWVNHQGGKWMQKNEVFFILHRDKCINCMGNNSWMLIPGVYDVIWVLYQFMLSEGYVMLRDHTLFCLHPHLISPVIPVKWCSFLLLLLFLLLLGDSIPVQSQYVSFFGSIVQYGEGTPTSREQKTTPSLICLPLAYCAIEKVCVASRHCTLLWCRL